MNKEKVIKKVYKMFESVTPLRTDCAKLCGGECCKGDSETGMILFPGEEEFFESRSDYITVKTSDGKNIVICSGKCDREIRPLSCRIFPLFPMLIDNKIYVFDDPRAKGFCPLLYEEMKIDKKFEKAVYKTGKILTKNSETRLFLEQMTDEITEILSMQQDLFG